MRYMLMMTGTLAGFSSFNTWSKEDVRNHVAFMMTLNKELKANGELIAGEGLAWPNQAVQVRAGQDGEPITDGVFPETKEFLAGFWIVGVDSAERAYQIAAIASAAPGKGGVKLNMPIEVRQIMDGPPDDTL
ncbi:MAG TPA: YciI family protein [Bryobacteraceae bacterium]|nr:YciI family protein [Bryobacteraceae bacterium]